MLRFSWVLVLLCACPPEPTELLLLGPSRVTDDGRAVEVTALVEGKSGVVSVEATAGSFIDDALPLRDGAAVFRYSCSRAEDSRCAGRVVITARFRNLEATKPIEVAPGGSAGGGTSNGAGGGQTGGGTGDAPGGGEAGGGFAGAGGGSASAGGSAPAGGSAGGGLGGGRPLPIDAGPPPFDCLGYDGGVHPGYTFEDGGALSLGCDGEPIDGVFLTTSESRVSVCGTVRLSQPAPMPVYPRSIFIGSLSFSNLVNLNCCSTLRCLRNPNEIRYRFEVGSGQFLLGVGARSDDFSYSQFGYFPGTPAAPLPDPDGGAILVIESVRDGGSPIVRNVDFFVGPGKRPGDP